MNTELLVLWTIINACCTRSGDCLLALFEYFLSMNALPQTGLSGECPNRPKSDFLSAKSLP